MPPQSQEVRSSLARRFAPEPEKLAFFTAFGLAVAYAAILAAGFRQHLWILDAAGRPVVNDFIVFWVAGHMALKGTVLAVYNARLEHAAELAAIGHTFRQLLGWSYPPLFLLIVLLPAHLPYAPAFIVWVTVTLALHAATVAAITERRIASMIACAVPWVLVELILGQNGFLTSAVLGMALLQLEERPIVSGVLLGFLSFKPQFGILIPFALAAGGYWRAFLWSAFATLAWNGLAGAIFGFDTYGAFLHALSTAAGNHLVRSDLGWHKLQSVYGFLRALGATASIAWASQVMASLAAVIAVVSCWRMKAAPFDLKAALLAAAIPIATPYILYYDVPVLAIALAFLFRHRNFDRFEFTGLALTVPFLLTPFLPAFVAVPGALFASISACILVLRRILPMSSDIPRLAFADGHTLRALD